MSSCDVRNQLPDDMTPHPVRTDLNYTPTEAQKFTNKRYLDLLQEHYTSYVQHQQTSNMQYYHLTFINSLQCMIMNHHTGCYQQPMKTVFFEHAAQCFQTQQSPHQS